MEDLSETIPYVRPMIRKIPDTIWTLVYRQKSGNWFLYCYISGKYTRTVNYHDYDYQTAFEKACLKLENKDYDLQQ